MVKQVFSGFTALGHTLILVYALFAMVADFSLPPTGLAILAAAPLLQRLLKPDTLHVTHHKVRFPRISLAVLVGLAMILVSGDRESAFILLGFLGVGLFLLDTYWARE